MEAGRLPSGMVTFVLTDIEGSTRLLRRLGHLFDGALDRHVELLRRSWEEHGGFHVSASGDSCLAAFADAGAALRACAHAQRLLTAEPWPSDCRLRVRMGVHSGIASPRDHDYVALAVHQAARVMAAAHGGQVLVSDIAAAEIQPVQDLELRPVGRYRLRDFDAPVPLFHLRAPGIDTDFPAVRAMPVDGHNLAAPPTPLVGRAHDVAGVLELVEPGRLLTLTGPGGVGKSRLAVALGLAAAPHWDDGVWLVELAPVQEPQLIGTAVATVVGAAVGTGADRWEDAVEHLRERRTLLVLDNCEHVSADVAHLVAELLSTCPGVGAVATSREPLDIASEFVWRVNPLELPHRGWSVDQASASPSVQLFVERARSTRADFLLDESNVDAVVQLCRRLDGLPLALELAAAQTALLSVADILRGLDDRFRTMRSRTRSAPERQRTMDAVMDWSYRRLGADEQAVLRRLSIFRSGFSLDAATVGGADVERCDVPEVVWALVDKSVVMVDVTANETRYRLLETVRAYARRLLDAEGETAATAGRLVGWWLERIGPWHPIDRARSGEIEVELDNVRALVSLVGEHAPEEAQQLVCTIGQYYYNAAQAPRDGVTELTRYASELAIASPARVSMLATLAMLHVHAGDVEAARAVVAEADRVRCAVDGAPTWDEVAIERVVGEVALRSGDHTAAVELARRTLERDLTDRARGRMLNLLAIASYFAGDAHGAAAAFDEELDLARRLDDEHLIVVAEGNVAELALRRGDERSAARHQTACLGLALALGRTATVAQSFIIAARLTASGDPARAAQLHAKAEDVLAASGFRLYDDDLRASQEMLEGVRGQLGDDDFDVACERGRSLSLLEATSLAQDTLERVFA